MTTELFNAAERTMHAAGLKPKDATAVLAKLESEFGVTASVEGGMLTLKQGDTVFSVGQMLQSYAAKFPREFYGGAGQVTFKSDLTGDNQAKMKFINEHGLDAWAALPLNEQSPGAQHVTTDAIPSAAMRASDYRRLSTREKSKLCGEIGVKGIEKICARR
jgi:hypothetical protein